MTEKSKRARLRDLDLISESMAQQATLLSARIEEVEQRLVQLPGKIEHAVLDDARDYGLTFGRNGQTWALFYGETEITPGFDRVALRSQIVSSGSLEVKVRAAKLLPKLLVELAQLIENRTNELAAAHQALDQAEKVLEEWQMGGA